MSEQPFTIGGLGFNLLWNLLTAYLQIFELCPFECVLLFIKKTGGGGVRDGRVDTGAILDFRVFQMIYL